MCFLSTRAIATALRRPAHHCRSSNSPSLLTLEGRARRTHADGFSQSLWPVRWLYDRHYLTNFKALDLEPLLARTLVSMCPEAIGVCYVE